MLMEDGKPFSTLSYTNGPGFLNHRTMNSSEDRDDIPLIGENVVQPRLDLTNDTLVGEFFEPHSAVLDRLSRDFFHALL